MRQIPIIVIAYNRPKSLLRLLTSIENASFKKNKDIPLIISIDYSNNQAVKKVSENFKWKNGEKIVINHSQKLGLKKHVIKCGDIVKDFEAIIVLEDDLYVAPDFYNYTCQAVNYFINQEQIAGISLYSPRYNDVSVCNFEPVLSGRDAFFMKVPSSSGQIWTSNQWFSFKEFISKHYANDSNLLLPKNARNWPIETSWKRAFYYYMIMENKYFVYPYVSLSTNLGEPGAHFIQSTNSHNSPLFAGRKLYSFDNLNQYSIKYNENNELDPEFFKAQNDFLNRYDFDVDLYNSIDLEKCDKPYLLSMKECKNPIRGFSNVLFPKELNVIYNLNGNSLFFGKREDFFIDEKTLTKSKQYLIRDFYLSSEESRMIKVYRKGVSNYKSTIEFRIGYLLLKPIKLLQKILNGASTSKLL